MSNKKKFGKGLAIGAIIGAIGGILFAPKSGKKTREDIKKVANSAKNKVEDGYENARAKVEEQIAAAKRAGNKINFDKYKELVSDVVEELKRDKKIAKKTSGKLKDRLHADWKKLSNDADVIETKKVDHS